MTRTSLEVIHQVTFGFPTLQTMTYAAAITLTLYIASQPLSRWWNCRRARR
jgi:hypothetical protein